MTMFKTSDSGPFAAKTTNRPSALIECPPRRIRHTRWKRDPLSRARLAVANEQVSGDVIVAGHKIIRAGDECHEATIGGDRGIPADLVAADRGARDADLFSERRLSNERDREDQQPGKRSEEVAEDGRASTKLHHLELRLGEGSDYHATLRLDQAEQDQAAFLSD